MLPDIAVNTLLAIHMQAIRWTRWRRLLAMAERPWQTQQRLLDRILRANHGTGFGKRYGFAGIRSYAAFADSVPVQTYETLRPFVDEQARSGERALTPAAPVLYALTSGTTGQPKRIPLLEATLRQHRWNQSVQTYAQYRTDPRAFHGRILGIVSPPVEGKIESGVPYGSASGHGYKTMPALAQAKYVLPHEVFEIQEYELKYLAILRLALTVRGIRCMFAANPSTFLKLLSVLRQHQSELLEDAAQGTFRQCRDLPSNVAGAIEPRLACSPERRRELERILSASDPRFSDLWPELRLVATWTGGSCGIALGALKPLLPAGTRVSEIGYLSSEFRGTIIVDPERSLGLPTIHENFFEFAACDAWDAGRKAVCTIDRVEEGKQYYVIVTTPAGLYRYFMNDIVTVTGSFRATPTIAFLQKGKGVTNITGEKLYENQVLQAVRAVEGRRVCPSAFVLMLAIPSRAVYRLIYEWPASLDAPVEDIGGSIDRELGELNVEYAQKRASGRLGRLELVPVEPGTGEAYKQHCLKQGQREGQFKTIALQYADDCSFPFERFAIDCPGVSASPS